VTREEAITSIAAALKEARQAEEETPAREKVRLSKDARIAELLLRYLPSYGLVIARDDGTEIR
jgi:hypothetical protein